VSAPPAHADTNTDRANVPIMLASLFIV
jgi:hypothetical protein